MSNVTCIKKAMYERELGKSIGLEVYSALLDIYESVKLERLVKIKIDLDCIEEMLLRTGLDEPIRLRALVCLRDRVEAVYCKVLGSSL